MFLGDLVLQWITNRSILMMMNFNKKRKKSNSQMNRRSAYRSNFLLSRERHVRVILRVNGNTIFFNTRGHPYKLFWELANEPNGKLIVAIHCVWGPRKGLKNTTRETRSFTWKYGERVLRNESNNRLLIDAHLQMLVLFDGKWKYIFFLN